MDKDKNEHDHVVIPLPANFAVLIPEALTIWRTQVVNQASIAERHVPPTEAASYRAAERALYDQIVATLLHSGAHLSNAMQPIAIASAAIEERRRLFPPPPDADA